MDVGDKIYFRRSEVAEVLGFKGDRIEVDVDGEYRVILQEEVLGTVDDVLNDVKSYYDSNGKRIEPGMLLVHNTDKMVVKVYLSADGSDIGTRAQDAQIDSLGSCYDTSKFTIVDDSNAREDKLEFYRVDFRTELGTLVDTLKLTLPRDVTFRDVISDHLINSLKLYETISWVVSKEIDYGIHVRSKN